MIKRRILISEEEKRTIKGLYGILNEQGVDTLLNVLSKDTPTWLKSLMEMNIDDLEDKYKTNTPFFIEYLEKTTGKSFDEIDKNKLVQDIHFLRHSTFKTHGRESDVSEEVIRKTDKIERLIKSKLLPIECESWFKNLFYMTDEEFNSLDSKKYMEDNKFTVEDYVKQFDLMGKYYRYFGSRSHFDIEDKFFDSFEVNMLRFKNN